NSSVGGDNSDPDFYRYSVSNAANSISTEVLVPRDDAEARRVKIACMGAATVPDAGSCTLYTSVADRLGLKYEMPRSQMPKWRTVDAKVMAWIDSVTIGCFDGPTLQPGAKPTAYYPCPF